MNNDDENVLKVGVAKKMKKLGSHLPDETLAQTTFYLHSCIKHVTFSFRQKVYMNKVHYCLDVSLFLPLIRHLNM